MMRKGPGAHPGKAYQVNPAKDREPGTLRVSGRLVCQSEQQADMVRRHLPEHGRLTKAEPGCLAFDVTATDDPLIWHVEESFRDRKALEFHQQRTRDSAWWAATDGVSREFEVFGLD